MSLPAAFRPSPPPADARIRWPDAFGTRFAVFVDTEEEFDWNAPFRRDGWGTSAIAALPAAHARFRESGAAVTYVVDHPVASDPAAVDALRAIAEDARAEIGAHLHPWVNPPFIETVSGPNSFAGNLPRALEAAKLDALGRTLTAALGRAPRIYRAGRYGIGPNTHALLAERGYRIDASIRAGYGYARQRGPDFRRLGSDAFRLTDDGALIAIPFGTVFTGRLRRWGGPLLRPQETLPAWQGLLSHAGLVERVSLTPEGTPLPSALEAVRVATGEGTRLLSFAYHSPSLAAGHTPYVRDASDLAAFWRWWDRMLDLLDRLGVRSASGAEMIAAADASLPDDRPIR